MRIEKIDAGLYRLLIPFEDLTTTVYIARYEAGVALIDSGSCAQDIDDSVLPALAVLNIPPDRVRVLALTHGHGDHGGGLSRLVACFPHAEVRAWEPLSYAAYRPLSDGELLLGGLRAVFLPGHTQTSVGYLDLGTKTLLSGDCLQLDGIGKYRNGIRYPALYLKSIEKLKGMGVARIVAAHEYDPLGSVAEGDAAVQAYLDMCADIAVAKKL